MTVRLTVEREPWLAHVRRMAADVPGLVPVVKGNGYGLGRPTLMEVAGELSDRVCVGTVHELPVEPAPQSTTLVLTPIVSATLAPRDTSVVVTVGSPEHVRPLAGWGGRVTIKLASSMRRFGTTPEALADLVAAVEQARLEIEGAAIHLPLAGSDAERCAEIERWLPFLAPEWTLSVSHLAADAYTSLSAAHPERRFSLRAGTALWHGDRSSMHLQADVLDVRPVQPGDAAGYRAHRIGTPGALVIVGAGTAHGVGLLPDGTSPFHHARRRMPLVEPPHMHTSMTLVAAGSPCPRVGDWVDVQRPLTTTLVDTLTWR